MEAAELYQYFLNIFLLTYAVREPPRDTATASAAGDLPPSLRSRLPAAHCASGPAADGASGTAADGASGPG